MPAKSLNEVREALATSPAGSAFARGFAEAYFSQALGVLPKGELDLLVFRLLIETQIIDPEGSIFAIARALNITPAKARSLLFQYQLRCIDETTVDAAVLKSLAAARFSVDDKRLSFGVESPLARATIDGRLKALGVYADISLSGDILKVPLDHFDTFITMLIGADRAKELERALRKDGLLRDGSLQAFLRKYGTEAAKSAAGAAGKECFSRLFSGLGEWISGGGAEAINDIMSGLA